MKELQNFFLEIYQTEIKLHLSRTQNCVLIGSLIASKENPTILSKAENQHISECKRCTENLQKLHSSYFKIIKRNELKRAAGDMNLDLIGDLLKGSNLPENTEIVCERRKSGYIFRVISEVPLKFRLEFYKENLFLCSIEISRIADTKEFVSFEHIKSFTEIRLYRR